MKRMLTGALAGIISLLLILSLAGCGGAQLSLPPGPIITPTLPPPTEFAATPDPTITQPSPTPARQEGLVSALWLGEGRAAPDGVVAPEGMVAGLISYILPLAHQDVPPEDVALVVDGTPCLPLLAERDPSGVISAWYAVDPAAQAIEMVLQSTPPVILGAVPTPEALATDKADTLIGEMEFVNAASPLIDLRYSPLLDSAEFPLPASGRVVGAGMFTHYSRRVSRVAVIDMPLDQARSAFAALLGKGDQDFAQTAEGRWSLAGENGEYAILIEGWDDMAATGLDGLSPVMSAKQGRCAVFVGQMASSWNTEVGGDEDPVFEGPKGNVQVERLTILAEFPEELGYAPIPGEVLLELELMGAQDAVQAVVAAAQTRSIRVYSQETKNAYMAFATTSKSLYFAVPLIDGPTELIMFGTLMELPLP